MKENFIFGETVPDRQLLNTARAAQMLQMYYRYDI